MSKRVIRSGLRDVSKNNIKAINSGEGSMDYWRTVYTNTAKRANDAIRRLRKSGFSISTLEEIEYYNILKGNKNGLFTQSSGGLDRDDIADRLYMMYKFLDDELRKPSVIKQATSTVAENFRKYGDKAVGYKISEDVLVSEVFIEFVLRGDFQELMDVLGGSDNDAMQDIESAILNGASYEDLHNAFNKFASGAIGYDTALKMARGL